MGRSFKSLFIEEDEPATVKQPKQSAPKKGMSFPKQSTSKLDTASFSVPITPVSTPVEPVTSDVCEPYMDQIMSMYEDGFKKLNQPGVEFYEFFEAVVDGGIDQPIAYKMALKILQNQEPSMSKETLISQSQFYIDELNKVHSTYQTQGTNKKSSIAIQQETEIDSIQSEISQLELQLQNIQSQIRDKKTKLNNIPASYKTELQEIDCKLMANDAAAQRIIKTIHTVVNGIKTNL